MAKPKIALYAPLALVLLIAFSETLAAPLDTDRVIRVTEGPSKDRDRASASRVDEPRELRASAAEVAAQSKARASVALSSFTLGDHWIYDADAALYDDFDADGYYRLISVRIDADTFFSRSFVYAVIYLSADGEWFEHLYTTKDFEINGATSDDEYFVDVELVSGYPPGRYDVLVELYDADLGLYMDEFGPAQSPALELLPLEDATFDVPSPPVIVVDEHGGGGAMSLWMVLGLLGLAVARHCRLTLRRAGPSVTRARRLTAE